MGDVDFAAAVRAHIFLKRVPAAFQAFPQEPYHYFSLLKLPVPPDFSMFVTTA
jgi:hypothetical protein